MKKQLLGFAVSLTAFTAFLGFGFAPSVSAAADTCTWTGATDSTFNDGGNWTGCDNSNVPEAGDTLRFISSGTASWTLTNDLGHAVAGVIVEASSGQTQYDVDTLTISSGGTVDAGAADNGSGAETRVTVTNLTASGALNYRGRLFNATNWTLSGVITLLSSTGNKTYFDGANVDSSGVVVQNGAELTFSGTPGATPNYPITLGGGSGSDAPVINFSGSGTWTFANPLTLVNNARIFLDDANTVVNQTGAITGTGFALTLDENSVDGSTLNLNPSSNSSATVAGTYVGGGSGSGSGAGEDEDEADAPDTGFGVLTANPIQTLAIVSLAGTALFFISRRVLAKSAVRR